MKIWITIGYWTLSVLLIALIVRSLGYRFADSLFIGAMFLPGALSAIYLLPKIDSVKKEERIFHFVCVVCAILLLEFMLMVLANIMIKTIHDEFPYYVKIPDVLVNPIFTAAIITLLALGYFFLDKYLKANLPNVERPVTFVSDRRNVSLLPHEICYVESRDTEVWIHATDNRDYRNKTGIAQWEALLDDDFIRVHRSFLVNKSAITSFSAESVKVGDEEIPVSRKYQNAVKKLSQE